MSIEQKVKEIVFQQLKSSPGHCNFVTTVEDVKMETALEDLCLDSLDLIEIVFEVETTLQVNIIDQDAENWKTVGDVVRSVENND